MRERRLEEIRDCGPVEAGIVRERLVGRAGAEAVEPVERVHRHHVPVGELVEDRVEEAEDVPVPVLIVRVVEVVVADVVDEHDDVVALARPSSRREARRPRVSARLPSLAGATLNASLSAGRILRSNSRIMRLDLLVLHVDAVVATVAGRELRARRDLVRVARHPDFDVVADCAQRVVLQVDGPEHVVGREPEAFVADCGHRRRSVHRPRGGPCRRPRPGGERKRLATVVVGAGIDRGTGSDERSGVRRARNGERCDRGGDERAALPSCPLLRLSFAAHATLPRCRAGDILGVAYEEVKRRARAGRSCPRDSPGRAGRRGLRRTSSAPPPGSCGCARRSPCRLRTTRLQTVPEQKSPKKYLPSAAGMRRPAVDVAAGHGAAVARGSTRGSGRRARRHPGPCPRTRGRPRTGPSRSSRGRGSVAGV